MLNRQQTIATLSEEIDTLVIGGGINGAVSASALAAHGVKVALIEANDFASMTSQESSNMIWGGIKYLQDFELSLVWSLCKSRNQLLNLYPNRVKEIPFVAVIGSTSPFSRGLGYLGSVAYWIFGRFQTQTPKIFSNQKLARRFSLLNLDAAKGAIQYNDAILLDNDSRFVYELIKTARTNGAHVINYCEMNSAQKSENGWLVTVTDKISANTFTIRAKTIVNATGPLTRSVNEQLEIPSSNTIVISKGVHLIVPKIETKAAVLAFFDSDGRLFYVLPMHDRTVIGTTDTSTIDANVTVTDEDREFLLAQANRCLKLEKPLTKADIIAERCGVRPLVVSNATKVQDMNWISLSRKHVVEHDVSNKSISIFGGKLTDCINVGEEVVEKIRLLGIDTKPAKHWVGESEPQISSDLVDLVKKFHPQSAEKLSDELWRRHGVDSFAITDSWIEDSRNAQIIFEGLSFTVGELQYIARNEHVYSQQDILRRRTPISLLRSAVEIADNQLLQNVLKLIP